MLLLAAVPVRSWLLVSPDAGLFMSPVLLLDSMLQCTIWMREGDGSEMALRQMTGLCNEELKRPPQGV